MTKLPPYFRFEGPEETANVIAKSRELYAYLEKSGVKPVAASGNQLRRMVTKTPAGLDLVTGLRIVGEAVRDYHVVREQERTKRAEIASDTAIRLAELEQAREMLAQYLNQSFDERKENFARLFEALDRAQAQGDQVGMGATLDGILSLAKSSPFMSLGEVRRRMADNDFEVEL